MVKHLTFGSYDVKYFIGFLINDFLVKSNKVRNKHLQLIFYQSISLFSKSFLPRTLVSHVLLNSFFVLMAQILKAWSFEKIGRLYYGYCHKHI